MGSSNWLRDRQEHKQSGQRYGLPGTTRGHIMWPQQSSFSESVQGLSFPEAEPAGLRGMGGHWSRWRVGAATLLSGSAVYVLGLRTNWVEPWFSLVLSCPQANPFWGEIVSRVTQCHCKAVCFYVHRCFAL